MRPFLTLGCLLHLAACISSPAADPPDFGHETTFSADNCLITTVETSGDNLYIAFSGRWKSSTPLAVFADTDQNGVLLRQAGMSEDWPQLVETAKTALNKRMSICVRSGGWVTMGGTPIFSVPPAAVRIFSISSLGE